MRPKGERSYCIWGEGPGPLPGLGISYTTDIDSGAFTQVGGRHRTLAAPHATTRVRLARTSHTGPLSVIQAINAY